MEEEEEANEEEDEPDEDEEVDEKEQQEEGGETTSRRSSSSLTGAELCSSWTPSSSPSLSLNTEWGDSGDVDMRLLLVEQWSYSAWHDEVR